jgi:hypothetical protein
MNAILSGLAFLIATQNAVQVAPCPCGPDLSGAWSSGRWESLADGHSGPLTATFERAGPGGYDVTFRGRFFRIIPFRYRVRLEVVGTQGDRVFLAGSSKLPIFGTYTSDAVATACDFRANFSAAKDHGTFTLRR